MQRIIVHSDSLFSLNELATEINAADLSAEWMAPPCTTALKAMSHVLPWIIFFILNKVKMLLFVTEWSHLSVDSIIMSGFEPSYLFKRLTLSLCKTIVYLGHKLRKNSPTTSRVWIKKQYQLLHFPIHWHNFLQTHQSPILCCLPSG